MTPMLPVRVPELAKIFDASNEIKYPRGGEIAHRDNHWNAGFLRKLDLAPDKVAADIRTTRAVDAKQNRSDFVLACLPKGPGIGSGSDACFVAGQRWGRLSSGDLLRR